MKAIIVTGSRDWTDEEAIHEVVLSCDVLIHGAAKGADAIADMIGNAQGIAVVPMPAQWKLLGLGAGHSRNGHMLTVLKTLEAVGYHVEVHAFPDEDSVGTLDMMQIAKEAEVEVFDHKKSVEDGTR